MKLAHIRKKIYQLKIQAHKSGDKLIGPVRRISLKPRDFTIVSCNCWDWAVYSRYRLPYSSPTVNLLFPPKDFLKLISDMPRYMKEEPVQIDLKNFHYCDYVIKRYQKGGFDGRNPENFIYCRVGDVDFVAWHYDTFEEVKDKWDRRKERVNYDKIMFKMHDMWECTFEDFQEYLRLTNGKNALFLTAKKDWKEYAGSDPRVIYVEKYAECGYVIDDVYHNVLPFSLTRYLNGLWSEK